ncbi:MAG: thioredoxin family protein [Gemmatimonadales bacterium]|jgi:hypothetical protein
MPTLTQERFETGLAYDDYRKLVQKHQGLWAGVYDHLELPENAVLRTKELPGRRFVAVLAEDWCGDAASLVPILAKLAAAAPEKIELRVFQRDENPDIMDGYLSHGGRSIPVAIVFDEDMRQLGWWGPRPAPAQALFREKLRALRAGRLTDKREEVNKPVLRWYREDRGRHTIDEFLMVLERGGEMRA